MDKSSECYVSLVFDDLFFTKKTYNSVYQKLQVLIESVKVILQVLGVEIAEKTP